MKQNKTVVTNEDVTSFLEKIEHRQRREDALELQAMFTRKTGFQAKMWGPSIIGYGRYHYRYQSGREGDFLATGFSPRASNLSIYIMPGYQDYSYILERLGKHKLGKSCLYLNKLSDIDMSVLEELVETGLRDLNKIWKVEPE